MSKSHFSVVMDFAESDTIRNHATARELVVENGGVVLTGTDWLRGDLHDAGADATFSLKLLDTATVAGELSFEFGLSDGVGTHIAAHVRQRDAADSSISIHVFRVTPSNADAGETLLHREWISKKTKLDLPLKLQVIGGEIAITQRGVLLARTYHDGPGIPQTGYFCSVQQGKLVLAYAKLDGRRRRCPSAVVRELEEQATALYAQLAEADAIGDVALQLELQQRIVDVDKARFGTESSTYLLELRTLGNLFGLNGRFSEGRTCLTQALNDCRSAFGAEHPRVIPILLDIANMETHAGGTAAALEPITEAMALSERLLGPEHVTSAKCLHRLGNVLLDLGRPTEAIKHFNSASELFEGGGTELCSERKSFRCNFGRAYHTLGDYKRARLLYESALATDTGEHDTTSVDVVIAAGLARLLEEVGDDYAAMDLYEQILASDRNGGELSHNYFFALNGLALLLRKRRMWLHAQRRLEESIHLVEDCYGPEHPYAAAAHNNLGEFLSATGDLDRAESELTYALQLRRQMYGETHPDVAESLHNLAINDWSQGRTQHAQHKVLAASEILEDQFGYLHPRVARTKYVLGQLYWAEARWQDALDVMLQSYDIECSLATILHPTLSEPERLASVSELAASRDAILSLLRQANDLDARTAFDIVYQLQGVVDQVIESHKDVRLSAGQSELWDQLCEVRRQLANEVLYPRPPEERSEHEEKIGSLTREKERLEREVARNFGRADNTTSDWTERYKALPKGTAIVCITRSAAGGHVRNNVFNWTPCYDAFIVAKTDNSNELTVRWAPLGNADAIDQIVGKWRKAIDLGLGYDRLGGGYKPAGVPRGTHDIARELLWEPIAPTLVKTDRVVIVADGPLHAVPWGALPGENSCFLVEEFSIVLSTSLPGTLGGDYGSSAPNGPLVALGGIDYRPETSNCDDLDGGQDKTWPRFRALPGTAEEVSLVTELCPSKNLDSFSGDQAIKGKVMDAMETASHLHLATHGYFAGAEEDSVFARLIDEQQPDNRDYATTQRRRRFAGRNPMLMGGLAMAGASIGPAEYKQFDPTNGHGIMTAEEVLNLNLTGARVAVLSACQTALGHFARGEGLFGLVRAFLLAGVDCVVASLWKVGDSSTYALMEEFYKQMWTQEQPASEALRKAQLHLLKQHSELHNGKPLEPRKWAGFVVAGDLAT